MEKIVVEHLFKIFGDNPERGVDLYHKGMGKEELLKETGLAMGVGDVSFTVNEGEILVIMGLSGSGKSTLVRCINRLIEPTAGKVLVDGKDVIGLSQDELLQLRRTKFGMVFQNFALFPHRRVLENVEYGLEIQGVEKEVREQKALDALELVGLKGWEYNYPSQLSGGMQQRVGLARGLALDPDILLMDEAFSALDPLIRRGMQDELIALQERMQKTILFITHDLDEALKLGDRIVLMKDGLVVQQGTGEEILTNPANDYVAQFVEDVDLSKVLTAQSVMKDPRTVAYHTDGPHVVLRKMDKHSISSIFVLNREHKLRGAVTAEDAAQAIKGEKQKGKDPKEKTIRDLENLIIPRDDFLVVHTDTPVMDFFADMANVRFPVAVVDERDHLAGVIVRGSLLAALAKQDINPPEDSDQPPPEDTLKEKPTQEAEKGSESDAGPSEETQKTKQEDNADVQNSTG